MRIAVLIALALFAACKKEAARDPVVDLKSDALYNRAAFVPPQCYTRTEDEGGSVHNPCYVCHQASIPPNYIGDADLQEEYAFSETSRINRWTNLFVDRRAEVAKIPDEEILAYVRTSNYEALPIRLRDPPPAWDVDADGKFGGFIPDIAFRFDEEGFDRNEDGRETGWRAYSYFPFPGTFWPTNGSFGDALIRLPEAFRQDAEGRPSRAIYRLNLALVEALVARRDVAIPEVDEKEYGLDLDGDGALSKATLVRFRHTPGRPELHFVGKAAELSRKNPFAIAPGLFPEGTELAHSVRYIDLVDGSPTMAPRMKELRYMRKAGWMSYGQLELQASNEAREKEFSPQVVRRFGGSSEYGIGNRAGWMMQGFIEDARGRLRPQSREEHAFCIGCHSGIGATTDSVFSFVRRTSWEHSSQQDLAKLGEPLRDDGEGEYSHYLVHNGAGDEFRGNEEVRARFFDEAGEVREEALAKLKQDVSALLLPSAARALELNKAYRLIVREQSFVRGRDATVAPAAHVHRELPAETKATGIEEVLEGPRSRTRPAGSPRVAATEEQAAK